MLIIKIVSLYLTLTDIKTHTSSKKEQQHCDGNFENKSPGR